MWRLVRMGWKYICIRKSVMRPVSLNLSADKRLTRCGEKLYWLTHFGKMLFGEPELKASFPFSLSDVLFSFALVFQDDGRLLEEAFFMYRMVKFGTAGRASVPSNGTRFMLDAISHRLWEVVRKHVIVKIVCMALSGGTLESCPVIEQVDLITEVFLVSAADGWFESSVLSSTYVFVWNRRLCVKVNFGDDMVGNISEGVPDDGAGLDIVWRRSPGPFIDERAQHKSRGRSRSITAHPCEVELWQGEMWLSRQHEASKFHFLALLLYSPLDCSWPSTNRSLAFQRSRYLRKVAVAVPKQPRVTEHPLSW